MSHQQDPAAASAPFDCVRTVPPFARSLRASHEIPVVAKRFSFEPARVEVKEGERIRLVVTSEDGVHGLEIKKFRVNKKIPRGGDKVTIDFVASAPGEYPILCSEYCGEGHEEMKGSWSSLRRIPVRRIMTSPFRLSIALLMVAAMALPAAAQEARAGGVGHASGRPGR